MYNINFTSAIVAVGSFVRLFPFYSHIIKTFSCFQHIAYSPYQQTDSPSTYPCYPWRDCMCNRVQSTPLHSTTTWCFFATFSLCSASFKFMSHKGEFWIYFIATNVYTSTMHSRVVRKYFRLDNLQMLKR